MPDDTPPDGPPRPAPPPVPAGTRGRLAREAAALRENLRRRKAQAAQRRNGAAPAMPDPGPGAGAATMPGTPDAPGAIARPDRLR